MSKDNSIWSSYECVAWSMGFNYRQYREHLISYGYKHAPLSFDGYSALCEIFDNSLEDDCK